MRVLLIGSGGREHALAWKIAQSPELTKLFCMPGNPGIAQHATCVTIEGGVAGIAEWAKLNGIDLVVVGPEQPLADGLANALQEVGVSCFGPTKAAARIESSKVFAKVLMKRHSIPTADFVVCDSHGAAKVAIASFGESPVVVKASGLAAGKGAIVCDNPQDALSAARKIMVDNAFGDAGKRVIVEKRLYGPEISIFAITDGTNIVVLPPSQDHKPVGENDTGPNTGGMGAYSPVPLITDDLLDRIIKTILRPTVDAMREIACPYHGVLYAGLMIVNGDPYVIEFNCRFGDPEAQVVLPIVGEDILPILVQAAAGRQLPGDRIIQPSGCALCVVLASGGYPGPYERNKVIKGLSELQGWPEYEKDFMIFQAGTARGGDNLVTAGGRVLGITGFGDKPDELGVAANRAYNVAERISFAGACYRPDIGYRVLEQ